MKKDSKKSKITQNMSLANATPLMAGESLASEVTQTRRNVSSTIERTSRFKNIDEGLIPFKYNTTGGSYSSSNSSMDVRDAVILCQKAYYNVAVFAQVINLMTEFSVGEIYLREGSASGRAFFKSLLEKINLMGLQDQFFREYYRSSNVFMYRADSEIRERDLKLLTQTYSLSKAGTKVILPIKYVMLNPADVRFTGSLSFSSGVYYKVLSDYELAALRRKPRSEEDEALYNSQTPEVKKLIDGRNSTVLIPLNKDKIYAVFNKKQDYEPFAVPMGFPVLDDINWKLEMKKMDMALTRCIQQVVLLVTMGAEPEKGGVNHKNLEAMQTLLANQSIGRVLVADYTTKAEFVTPKIAELLDPKKYEVVNADINQGLNNILVGAEKFANQQAKMDVFIARLEQGRRDFIDFLGKEIKRIAKELGMKNYPKPYFDEITLKDDINRMRLFNRLIELNVLTPEEGITALNTGRLPSPEESIESQKKFKPLRDDGYYYPLVGGSQKAEENGRPAGTSGIKQTTKNISPIGAKGNFSLNKITENMLLAQKLENSVVAEWKKKFGLKKLNASQQGLVSELANLVIVNEEPDNWLSKASEYCAEPVDKNLERVEKVKELAAKHNVDFYLAGILKASEIKG